MEREELVYDAIDAEVERYRSMLTMSSGEANTRRRGGSLLESEPLADFQIEMMVDRYTEMVMAKYADYLYQKADEDEPPEIEPVEVDENESQEYEENLRARVLDPLFKEFRAGLAQAHGAAQAYSIISGKPPPNLGTIPEEEARPHFERLNGKHRSEIIRTFRDALGISVEDLLNDRQTMAIMNAVIADNVSLIKTIPEGARDDLAKRLQKAFEDAPFDQTLVKQAVQESYNIANNRVKLITRDQTTKAYGRFTEVRQRQIGVKRYRWSTSKDDRVRETHRANEGVVFDWDEPPATGIPGEEINCRCVAIPVLDDIEISEKPPVAEMEITGNILGSDLVGSDFDWSQVEHFEWDDYQQLGELISRYDVPMAAEMNYFLRHGAAPPDYTEGIPGFVLPVGTTPEEWTKRVSGQIKGFLRRFRPARYNMRVYRGDKRKLNLNVGDIYEDDGFMYTSTDTDVAGIHAGEENIFQLVVPQGRLVGLTNVDKQSEVILRPNSKFRILDKHRNIPYEFHERTGSFGLQREDFELKNFYISELLDEVPLAEMELSPEMGRFDVITPTSWEPVSRRGKLWGIDAAAQGFKNVLGRAVSGVSFRSVSRLREGARKYHHFLYGRINRFLRTGLTDPGMDYREIQGYINDILAEMQPLPVDHIVYRGENTLVNFDEGDFVTDPAFLSTSKDPYFGNMFAERGTVFQMRAPRGTPAIVANDAEGEFLLGNELPWRVVERHDNVKFPLYDDAGGYTYMNVGRYYVLEPLQNRFRRRSFMSAPRAEMELTDTFNVDEKLFRITDVRQAGRIGRQYYRDLEQQLEKDRKIFSGIGGAGADDIYPFEPPPDDATLNRTLDMVFGDFDPDFALKRSLSSEETDVYTGINDDDLLEIINGGRFKNTAEKGTFKLKDFEYIPRDGLYPVLDEVPVWPPVGQVDYYDPPDELEFNAVPRKLRTPLALTGDAPRAGCLPRDMELFGPIRVEKEKEIFGLAPDAEKRSADMPKHGFVAGKKLKHDDVQRWGFSENFVRFKPRVRRNATATLGNSWHGNTGGSVAEPVPLNNPDRRFFSPLRRRSINWDVDSKGNYSGQVLDKVKDATSRFKRKPDYRKLLDVADSGTYVESQMYGDVGLDDIDTIFTQSKSQKTKIESALRKAGKLGQVSVEASPHSTKLQDIWGVWPSTPKAMKSLTPTDIDNLGDDYIDKIWDVTGRELFAAKQGGLPKTLRDVLQSYDPGSNPYTGHREVSRETQRQILKDYYRRMARGSKGGLPKSMWSQYDKERAGFTSDILNVDLLERYDPDQNPTVNSNKSRQQLDRRIRRVVNEYDQDEIAGDPWLLNYAKTRWGSQRARVISGDEFDRIEGPAMLRGTTEESFIEDTLAGNFIGTGHYGNGHYFAYGNRLDRPRKYARGSQGRFYGAKLDPEARVFRIGDSYETLNVHKQDEDDVQETYDAIDKILRYHSSVGSTELHRDPKTIEERWSSDIGRVMADAGYDAYEIGHQDYMVILNQNKLLVDERSLPGREFTRRVDEQDEFLPTYERLLRQYNEADTSTERVETLGQIKRLYQRKRDKQGLAPDDVNHRIKFYENDFENYRKTRYFDEIYDEYKPQSPSRVRRDIQRAEAELDDDIENVARLGIQQRNKHMRAARKIYRDNARERLQNSPPNARPSQKYPKEPPPSRKALDDSLEIVFGDEDPEKILRQVLSRDKVSVYSAIKDDNLMRVIREGQLKHSLETDKVTLNSGMLRIPKEKLIFGLDDKVEYTPSNLPKYGFIADKDEMDHARIANWGYGQNFIRYKPGLRNRTTVTFGDSHFENIKDRVGHPVYLNNPTKEFFSPLRTTDINWRPNASGQYTGTMKRASLRGKERLLKDPNYKTMIQMSDKPYIEAQVYGQIDLNDIDAVVVQSKKVKRDLENVLKEVGNTNIKVETGIHDFRLRNLWERNATQTNSLTPDDVNRLGDPYIDRIWETQGKKLWDAARDPDIDMPDTIVRSLKRHNLSGSKYGYENIPISDRREILRDFYGRMEKKEEGGLPKSMYRKHNAKRAGFTSDVLNEPLLVEYRPGPPTAPVQPKPKPRIRYAPRRREPREVSPYVRQVVKPDVSRRRVEEIHEAFRTKTTDELIELSEKYPDIQYQRFPGEPLRDSIEREKRHWKNSPVPTRETLDKTLSETFGRRDYDKAIQEAVSPENTSVYMAATDGNLLSAIRDNKFKNSLEIDKRTETILDKYRIEKEKRVFGLDDDVEQNIDDMPKYGFLSGRNEVDINVGDYYGSNYVKFKPGVRERTTAVLGDSFTENVRGSYAPPVHLNRPNRNMMNPVLSRANVREQADGTVSVKASKKLKSKAEKFTDDPTLENMLKITDADYIETQIYGELNLDDVEGVFVQSRRYRNRLNSVLEEAGKDEDVFVATSMHDTRLENVWKGFKRREYSLTPNDVDNLGDKYVDRLWTGEGFPAERTKKRPAPGAALFNAARNDPESLTPELRQMMRKYRTKRQFEKAPIEDKRDILKTYYSEAAKREDGELGSKLYRNYNKRRAGFTDDVLNTDLLEEYDPKPLYAPAEEDEKKLRSVHQFKTIPKRKKGIIRPEVQEDMPDDFDWDAEIENTNRRIELEAKLFDLEDEKEYLKKKRKEWSAKPDGDVVVRMIDNELKGIDSEMADVNKNLGDVPETVFDQAITSGKDLFDIPSEMFEPYQPSPYQPARQKPFRASPKKPSTVRNQLQRTTERKDRELSNEIYDIEQENRVVHKKIQNAHVQLQAWRPEDGTQELVKWNNELNSQVEDQNRIKKLIADRKAQKAELYLNSIEHGGEGADFNWSISGPASAEDREVIEEGVDMFRRLIRTWPNDEADITFRIDRGRNAAEDIGGGSTVISTSGKSNPYAVIHELGHALEYADPSLMQEAADFLYRRTQGERLKSMRDMTGKNHRSNEMGWADEFITPYMGRDYRWNEEALDGMTYVDDPRGSDEKVHTTEIVAVGLHRMVTNPRELAENDPEMFDFIYDRVMNRH